MPKLPNYPVLIMGNYPEIVGDSVPYDIPVLGQCSVEELEDRFSELPEVRIEPVVRHMAMHHAP